MLSSCKVVQSPTESGIDPRILWSASTRRSLGQRNSDGGSSASLLFLTLSTSRFSRPSHRSADGGNPTATRPRYLCTKSRALAGCRTPVAYATPPSRAVWPAAAGIRLAPSPGSTCPRVSSSVAPPAASRAILSMELLPVADISYSSVRSPNTTAGSWLMSTPPVLP